MAKRAAPKQLQQGEGSAAERKKKNETAGGRPQVVIVPAAPNSVPRASAADMAATAHVAVLFASPEHAAFAVAALSVDAELHPERVTKTLAADGAHVRARFEAADARALRASMGAYLDMLGVVLRTLREFGDGE